MRYDNDTFGRRFPGGGGGFRQWGGGTDYGREMRRGYEAGYRSARGYGGDYWWLGEREMQRRGGTNRYDEAYQRFTEQNRPRFSPVGGMHPAAGGRYASGRPPRPLAEPTWFSDWTRWF